MHIYNCFIIYSSSNITICFKCVITNTHDFVMLDILLERERIKTLCLSEYSSYDREQCNRYPLSHLDFFLNFDRVDNQDRIGEYTHTQNGKSTKSEGSHTLYWFIFEASENVYLTWKDMLSNINLLKTAVYCKWKANPCNQH